MAQLSDDCFAFGGPLMSVDEAVALLGERVTVVAGVEIVPLASADGRIAVGDVIAPIDLPPFDNSAVDGYAVRHADLGDGETTLPVAGRIAAGGSSAGVAVTGSAVRIFTGAPMPADADTVFMQEDVRVDGGRVTLPPGLKPGANRRPAGEDVRKDAVAIAAGQRLRPQDLALAAALGISEIGVRRRLRVGVFSTGDELNEPGAALKAGAIYDSNRVLLAALLRRLGADVSDLGILRDEPAALATRLAAAAAAHDLILTSGGVSTGEEDHVRAAVQEAGTLVFWRLAIKPGRPLAMGMIGGVPVVGLPGNPAAVYVTFSVVVRRLIAQLSGARFEPPLGLPVRAGFRYRKKAGRREYVRVSLRPAADGTLEAQKFAQDGAGIVSSLTATDGLAELPDEVTEIAEGDQVRFFAYSELW